MSEELNDNADNVSTELASEIAQAVEAGVAVETERNEGTEEQENLVSNADVSNFDLKEEEAARKAEETAKEEETVQSTRGSTDESTEDPEGEPKGTKETPAEQKAVVAPHAVSDEILERALNVDLSMNDVQGLPPGVLSRVIESRERALAQDIEPKEEVKEPEDLFADMPKFDPEIQDPSVIEMFKRHESIIKQQQEQLREYGSKQVNAEAALQSAEDARQQVEVRDVTRFFDKQVAGLGEDFHETLGVGDFDSIESGSPQFIRRNEIATHMTVLLSGYQATGAKVPPREKVFETAARTVLGDEYQKISERKLSGSIKKQAGQHIQRAGGTKASSKVSDLDSIAEEINEKFFS